MLGFENEIFDQFMLVLYMTAGIECRYITRLLSPTMLPAKHARQVLWTRPERSLTFKLLWTIHFVLWPRPCNRNVWGNLFKVCTLDELQDGEFHDEEELFDAILELS